MAAAPPEFLYQGNYGRSYYKHRPFQRPAHPKIQQWSVSYLSTVSPLMSVPLSLEEVDDNSAVSLGSHWEGKWPNSSVVPITLHRPRAALDQKAHRPPGERIRFWIRNSGCPVNSQSYRFASRERVLEVMERSALPKAPP